MLQVVLVGEGEEEGGEGEEEGAEDQERKAMMQRK
jgi:hypothetical protein